MATLLAGAAALQTGPIQAATLLGAAATDLVVEPVVEGLTSPTDVVVLADKRIVVTERNGRVLTVLADGTEVPSQITVQSGMNEQGLLGVVAHPNFAANRYLYFYASVGDAANRHHVIRYTLESNGTITNATPLVTMGLRGPANHNGGGLEFHGGHLYISVGDTGSNATPPQNKFGSCLNVPNGKILRVNPDDGAPVGDNPLVGLAMVGGCDSATGAYGQRPPDTRIFAWGLRNPFRFWIDPQTSKLWIGDVGEGTREEISVGGAGTHFGWPFYEGTTHYPTLSSWAPSFCQSVTPARNCTAPVYDYATAGGASVIGGRIIDSAKFPEPWRSRYVFGDYQQNKMWTLDVNANRDGVVANSRTDFANVSRLSSIRLGADGALYLVEYSGGVVSKVAPLQVPVALGEPCTVDDLCDSDGVCVDGVCCEEACDGECEACNLSGQEGTCAAVPVDQEAPECPADPITSCDRDGRCDGARACRQAAKLGAACGATTCEDGQITGAICDGEGDCVPNNTASCGVYACSGDACAESCEDDSSCEATSGYCLPGGTCAMKKLPGEACTEARECGSGYCVDGVCCESECAEQCAACNELSSPGACVPVEGAPRGAREACTGDPATCGGQCDGNDPVKCVYRSNRVCATSCVDGQQTTSNCDGAGECVEGATSTCGNYVCGPDACLTSCSTEADCAGGYSCADGKCEPSTGTCIDSDTSQNANGDVRECAPYVCNTSNGLCSIECRSSVDCVSGYVCNADTDECEAGSSTGDDGGCGCRVGAAGSAAGSLGALGLLALLALRRNPRRGRPWLL